MYQRNKKYFFRERNYLRCFDVSGHAVLLSDANVLHQLINLQQVNYSLELLHNI